MKQNDITLRTLPQTYVETGNIIVNGRYNQFKITYIHGV